MHGNAFLKEYAKEINLENNQKKAKRILTSILFVPREIIFAQESLQFIAHLPMFLKASYVNRWNIKQKAKG